MKIPAAKTPSVRGPVASYPAFRTAVVEATLREWLGRGPSGQRVLDLSGDAGLAPVLAGSGHRVLCVLDPEEMPTGDPRIAGLPAGPQYLRADARVPDWLADDSLDLVVAEGTALSRSLAFEETLIHLARALRPGGRLLMAVDSLVAGLADLAEHGRWAELADAPSAEVVLVPHEDGGATRVYWPAEVQACLTEVGLEPEWIRPRTVLPPDVVERSGWQDPTGLADLVQVELRLEAEREGDTLGHRLVASARKPARKPARPSRP